MRSIWKASTNTDCVLDWKIEVLPFLSLVCAHVFTFFLDWPQKTSYVCNSLKKKQNILRSVHFAIVWLGDFLGEMISMFWFWEIFQYNYFY